MGPADEFDRTLEISQRAKYMTNADRKAYIAEACGTNSGLVQDVEQMLSRTAPWLGKRVGAHRVESLLSETSNSQLYRLELNGAQRLVIKLPRGTDNATRRRLEDEFHTLWKLRDHPNIVKATESGRSNGEPYFIMEYVEGKPLDGYCLDDKTSLDYRLRLFLDLCDAVHYAHQRGVIHRDIKPGNVLVSPQGHLKLLDFGIARPVDAEAIRAAHTLQQDGMPCTPDYASPEQLRSADLTVVSDIYSLGVVLFKLLTGAVPFHLGSADHLSAFADRVHKSAPPKLEEALDANLAGIPSDAKDWVSSLRGNIRHVVQAALEKDPKRRYSSTESLSQDVVNLISNGPVWARYRSRDQWPYTLQTLWHKHPWPIILSFTLFFAIAIASGLLLVARNEATQAQQLATKRLQNIRSVAGMLPKLVGDVQAGKVNTSISPSELAVRADRLCAQLEDKLRDTGIDLRDLTEARSRLRKYSAKRETEGTDTLSSDIAEQESMSETHGALAQLAWLVGREDMAENEISAFLQNNRKLSQMTAQRRFAEKADARVRELVTWFRGNGGDKPAGAIEASWKTSR